MCLAAGSRAEDTDSRTETHPVPGLGGRVDDVSPHNTVPFCEVMDTISLSSAKRKHL